MDELETINFQETDGLNTETENSVDAAVDQVSTEADDLLDNSTGLTEGAVNLAAQAGDSNPGAGNLAEEAEELAAQAEDLADEAEDLSEESEDLADEAEDLAAQAEALIAAAEELSAQAEDLADEAEDLADEAEDLADEAEDLADEAGDLADEAGDLADEAEGEDVDPEAEGEDIDPEAEGEDIDPEAEGEDIDPEAEGEDVDPEAEGEDIDPEAEGEDVDPEAEGEDIDPEAEGEDIDPEAEGEDIDPEAEGEDIDPEAEGEDVDGDIDSDVSIPDLDANPDVDVDDVIDLEDNPTDVNIDDGDLDTSPDLIDVPEPSDGSILGAPVGGPPDAEGPEIIVDPDTQGVSIVNEEPTISVIWDQAAQEALADANQGPTAAAYQLGLLHTAIYDAWSAYDETAISSTTGDDALQRPAEENTDANKVEAASFAAYQTLSTLLPNQEAIFADVLREVGFEPDTTLNDPTTAAGVGNLAAEALLESRANDGSNALGDDPNGNGTPFSDTTGFVSPNAPDDVEDISLFTPENTPVNNLPLGEGGEAQEALTPQFGDVDPFGLESGDQFRPDGPEGFLAEGVEADVDLDAGTITLADGTVEEISPDLIGPVINPGFIEQAEDIIQASADLTDEQKLIAEFWEDGPGTSFPPGNGLAFGQYVSARDNNTLDEDAELFFSLGNSQLDSAIASWDAKYAFNYARPLRAIRELGRQGLIGEFNEELGGNAIEAYAGPGLGTQTVLAEDFITYQFGETEASPPFPEYVSGHSTFSAAAAEVLQQFTGSDEFGGSVSFDPGSSRFEPGLTPGETVTLEWDTFSEFADESGISRIFGGIHWEDGDLDGRQLGRDVGQASFDQAQFFINGGDGSGSDPVTGNDGSEALTGAADGVDDSLTADAATDIETNVAPVGSDELIAEAPVDPIADAANPGIGEDPLASQNDVLDDGQGNNDQDLLFAPPELATV